MRLPNDEIGISDIIQWQDCRRRWKFSMRRHVEGDEPPEDQHPDTMYGTVFHDTVEMVEKHDLTPEEALQTAFDMHSSALDPEDIDKIREDIDLYFARNNTGVRTIANELEIRLPLMKWTYPGDTEPTQIYFRARIDRLYQRLDNESVFLHRDYKSSKWEKSDAEIHRDKQMWAYNWAIFEFWPECEKLTQIYDQLRYGAVPTGKSEEQRESMKQWLVAQVTSILKAGEEETDPALNEWCPWCPAKMDCPIIDRLTDYEVARIQALLPADEEPDTDLIGVYVEKLPEVQTAVKLLKAWEERIKGLLKALPADRREELGWTTSPRANNYFAPEALGEIHGRLGHDFYGLAKLSQSKVKEFVVDPEEVEAILGLLTKGASNPVLKQKAD